MLPSQEMSALIILGEKKERKKEKETVTLKKNLNLKAFPHITVLTPLLDSSYVSDIVLNVYIFFSL